MYIQAALFLIDSRVNASFCRSLKVGVCFADRTTIGMALPREMIDAGAISFTDRSGVEGLNVAKVWWFSIS